MTAAWPNVPAAIMAGVQQRWPDRTQPWANAVVNELRTLCAKYDATPRTVMPARFSLVVAADTPHGPIVLRSSPDPDGPRQAQVAAALAAIGVAPALHEATTNSTGTWMILDEVQPGTPLGDINPAEISLEALAMPLAAIGGNPGLATGLPHISDWLRHRLEDDHLTEVAPQTEPAPAEQRRNAQHILDDLSRNSESALCHGDASPWNLLADGTAGWMLIDPRGVSGEVEYDLAILTMKVATGRARDAVITRLARTCDADPGRLRAWTLVAEAARV
ncbi:MAG TPA: phosphotransferase [Micromonosporaceae bacterium]|nr:phosphotransferase [Micromonosporaceae bacterium]